MGLIPLALDCHVPSSPARLAIPSILPDVRAWVNATSCFATVFSFSFKEYNFLFYCSHRRNALSSDVMRAIMSEEKKMELDKITLTSDKLYKFFPKSYTPEKMEQTIFKLLEQWQRKRQQSQDR